MRSRLKSPLIYWQAQLDLSAHAVTLCNKNLTRRQILAPSIHHPVAPVREAVALPAVGQAAQVLAQAAHEQVPAHAPAVPVHVLAVQAHAQAAQVVLALDLRVPEQEQDGHQVQEAHAQVPQAQLHQPQEPAQAAPQVHAPVDQVAQVVLDHVQVEEVPLAQAVQAVAVAIVARAEAKKAEVVVVDLMDLGKRNPNSKTEKKIPKVKFSLKA